MSSYSFPQLEELWLAEGGSPAWAETMAAVAEVESSGSPTAQAAPGGATGLWQIEPQNAPGANLDDPATNAQVAVRLLGPVAPGTYAAPGIDNWGYTSTYNTHDPVGTASEQAGSVPLSAAALQSLLAPSHPGVNVVPPPSSSTGAPADSSGGGTWLNPFHDLTKLPGGLGTLFSNPILNPLGGSSSNPVSSLGASGSALTDPLGAAGGAASAAASAAGTSVAGSVMGYVLLGIGALAGAGLIVLGLSRAAAPATAKAEKATSVAMAA
jgi:hypothetical protein